MQFPVTLIGLAGAVALLLWGVHMVRTGVQRAFGTRLRGVLAGAFRTRLTAFLAGVGVTAALQSSTATGLMVTGFAAGGMVELVPALAVMLGANVGTTLIVQALSFDVAALSPVLVLLGVLMFRRGGVSTTRDLGRAAIGLGLMLLALRQLLDLVTPYEDVPSLRLLLGQIATEPVLDVVLAAGVTWAAHSSVAIVLLVMSLAAKGVIPPAAAFALVLGANLGTAINPVLEGGGSGGGTEPAARRVSVGNLLMRVAGVVAMLAVLPLVAPWLVRIMPGEAQAIAGFHTGFNLALAAVFLPALPLVAAGLRRMLPARVDAADPSVPLYLDPGMREAPALALGAAAREAMRLADVLEAMLEGARHVLAGGSDRGRLDQVKAQDDVLDGLNGAIRDYLTGLDPDAMTEADQQRAVQVLAFSTNLEHAGDVVERNLLAHAAKQAKRGLPLSAQQRDAVGAVMDRLLGNLRTAATVLMTGDLRAARLLAEEKETFRDLEARATAAHFERRREAGADEASGLNLDLIRDLKRVNAHLVAAAAYPVLESHGELMPSRVRRED